MSIVRLVLFAAILHALVPATAGAQGFNYNSWSRRPDRSGVYERYRQGYGQPPLNMVSVKRSDALGGDAAIRVPGPNGEGQVDQYTVVWSFDRDISILKRGDKVVATIQITQFGVNNNLKIPYVTVGMSTGGRAAAVEYLLPPSELKYFGQIGVGITPEVVGRATGATGEVVGKASVTMDVGGANSDSRMGAVYVSITAVSSAPVTGANIEIWEATNLFDGGELPSGTLTMNRSALLFGAARAGSTLTSQTAAQTVSVIQTGTGALPWTATANQPWITVTPASGAGTGAFTVSINNNASSLPIGGSVTGVVTLGSAATNAPQTLAVTLVLYGSTTAPFGAWDSPANGTTGIVGSLAITGWTLDDIEVTTIRIYRGSFGGETPGQQIFLGNAILVDGARPDVELANPTRPFNYRAGWGYLLLTNQLPNQGNGTYTLFVHVDDREGKTTLLGTRSVTIANNTSTKPFGAIDTPKQGETISGTAYVNFGWALTPLPKAISTDGSTITVYIDGVAVGKVTYNQFRADIASAFPGYANSSGAVGLRTIDTTKLANGIHTISWNVSDNAGVTEGIGSRYFSVQNGTSTVATQASPAPGIASVVEPQHPSGLQVTLSRAPLVVAIGYDDARVEAVDANDGGVHYVTASELDRLAIRLPGGAAADVVGYLIVGGELRPLPIGSTLDREAGIFTWQPGPGFLGEYDLVFFAIARDAVPVQTKVRIVLTPQHE